MTDRTQERSQRDDTQARLIPGHRYDGIHEYDNPMPGWWLGLFALSIIFAIIYVLGLHVFDVIDSYEDDLTESLTALEAQRAAYAEAHPSFDATPEALAALMADPEAAASGAATYAVFCSACHGAEAQGGIGPNLTDPYWIHGGSEAELFAVISDGVADKGMPKWDATLSPGERAQVIAFIRSLEGTNPPGAKQPEGAPAG